MAKDRKLYLNERTTIRDVAQEEGVSLTTVSHALNGYKDVSEKTRQKVMEVARRLDYIPDEAGRSLRGIQKKTIALLLAGELPEEDPSGIMFGLTSGIYDSYNADKQADKNQFWADLQEKETGWNHS